MSTLDVLSILALLGLGGVVGAVASAALAAKRAQAALEAFGVQLRSMVRTSTDPEAAALLGTFEAFEAEWSTTWSALARLRRLLRIP